MIACASLVLLLSCERHKPELQVCAGCRAHAIVVSMWCQAQGSIRRSQSSHHIQTQMALQQPDRLDIYYDVIKPAKVDLDRKIDLAMLVSKGRRTDGLCNTKG
ncbi:hypothetical protein ABBQ32_000524 [Trebouxia sp. C0010 RCD-2024]